MKIVEMAYAPVFDNMPTSHLWLWGWSPWHVRWNVWLAASNGLLKGRWFCGVTPIEYQWEEEDVI